MFSLYKKLPEISRELRYLLHNLEVMQEGEHDTCGGIQIVNVTDGADDPGQNGNVQQAYQIANYTQNDAGDHVQNNGLYQSGNILLLSKGEGPKLLQKIHSFHLLAQI